MSDMDQIEVTLAESKAPNWRRIQVPETIKLSKPMLDLHVRMGWASYRMHAFHVGAWSESVADPELEMANEGWVTLNKVVEGEKANFRHEYDFGDGWDQQLLIEKVFPADPDVSYPHCVLIEMHMDDRTSAIRFG